MFLRIYKLLLRYILKGESSSTTLENAERFITFSIILDKKGVIMNAKFDFVKVGEDKKIILMMDIQEQQIEVHVKILLFKKQKLMVLNWNLFVKSSKYFV